MLLFVGKRPEDLEIGDLVSFDYANPNHNQISRCGTVENFTGKGDTRCILVFDYSLEHGGPGYRSYRLSRIRGLGVIVRTRADVAKQPLQQFKRNLTDFADRLLKNS
jgi:hypothetical protein